MKNIIRKPDMKGLFTALLKCVCIAALTAAPVWVAAQSKTVKGIVTDGANGSPLVGVSVVVKGTTTGTATAVDGSYSVQAGSDAILIFSYIGYQTQETPVGVRSVVDAVMQQDTQLMDEVVVVGYGTQSRRTVTSAISRVDGSQLESMPVNSLGDALKGRVAGMRVSTANNEPGSDPVFMIRGGSSINGSNAPIYVVDGVPREISGINPNDIESIEVLKDAASAGIYGAKASNGIVLVTTKKGSRGSRPQVTFEAQYALTSPGTRFDLMNARDYIGTMRKMIAEYPSTYVYGSGLLNGANSSGAGNNPTSGIWTTHYVDTPEDVPAGYQVMVDPVDTSRLIAFQDNDQQKQWFRNSYWMNYYVGVNGGTEKVTYAASVGYLDDGGIGINTDYSRFTFHGNTSFKITDKLTATAAFDYSQKAGNTLPSSGIANWWTTVGRGMFMPNTHRDRFDDGTPAQGTNNTTMSAVWFDTYYTYNYSQQRSSVNFKLDWDITKDLKATGQITNFNRNNMSNQRLAGNAISNKRQTYEGWSKMNRLDAQGYLNYTKTFGNGHNLDIVGGIDYMETKNNGMSMTVTGADSDKIPTLAVGTEVSAGWTDTNTMEKLLSYFGRINYDYQKKYLLTLLFRADGSSLFPAGNRWGYFPSASAGWVISEEDFWNVSDFNTLKLRLSYGLTGNNYAGIYDSYGSYDATKIYNGSATVLPSTLPNLALMWENTKQFDVGFDMEFVDRRIRVAVDYYNKRTDNLIFEVQLPDTSGYDKAKKNIGSLRIQGLDFHLTTENIKTRNFSWTTDFTYGFNMNKVLSLPDEYYYVDHNGKDAWRIGGYTMTESGERFGGTAVGERMGRIYGYKTAYIIETTAQADAALYDANSHGVRRSDGKSIAGRKDIGDYEWMNRPGSALTADGKEQISDQDMYLLGYVVPHSTGGMNNTFIWKNLTLSVYVDYALGHSIYNYMYTRNMQTSMGDCNWNLSYDALNTWSKPGDDTNLARLSPNDADGGNKNYSRASNISVQKGDYLCLRDVTLAYNLPDKWMKKIGVGGMTVSVSGNTLGYLTKVKGISPESGADSDGGNTGMYSAVNTSGADFNIYPPTRKIIFGLKVRF
jgi:TonB-linked SusC/RagA family outer membrane protein